MNSIFCKYFHLCKLYFLVWISLSHSCFLLLFSKPHNLISCMFWCYLVALFLIVSLTLVKGCDTTLSGDRFCKKAQTQGNMSFYTAQSTTVYWVVILLVCNRTLLEENLCKCKEKHYIDYNSSMQWTATIC